MQQVLGHRLGYTDGEPRYKRADTYLQNDDGLDRHALALQNHERMLAQGVPPRVIFEQLAGVLPLCRVCAKLRPPERMTCSMSCRNTLAGRGNLGRPRAPMSDEAKEHHAEATRQWAREHPVEVQHRAQVIAEVRRAKRAAG